MVSSGWILCLVIIPTVFCKASTKPELIIPKKNALGTVKADATGQMKDLMESTKRPDSGCMTSSMFVTTRAIAVLMSDATDAYGTIRFDQLHGSGPVHISGAIVGLEPGLHRFHIHENGNIGTNCNGAGPLFRSKSAPSDSIPAGDLGNVFVGVNGVAIVDLTKNGISLNGDDINIIGNTIVIHDAFYDLAGTGKTWACGVIGIMAEEEKPMF